MNRSLAKYRRTAVGLGATLLAAAPALAQTLGQGADDGIAPWRIVLAMAVGVALAVALPFALKARGTGLRFFRLTAPRDSQLKLLECVRLGRNADLCLVECEGRKLLLAVSSAGVVQCLDQHGGPLE